MLDEIGEMSPALQAKLLQVLQDGQFCRLGARSSIKVDVRILAATNINMGQAIAEKSFREDLYYRLSSFVPRMPSLRERKDEISMMLRHFMLRVAERYACPIQALSPRLLRACESYSWPGNIRELENFVKRYLVLGDEESAIRELASGADNLQSSVNALEKTGWNRKRAAMMLNISYKALRYKIRQYDIHPKPLV